MLHARVFEQADVADRWLHDLRRTMGSWQAGTDANLSVTGRSLNHKSTATTGDLCSPMAHAGQEFDGNGSEFDASGGWS